VPPASKRRALALAALLAVALSGCGSDARDRAVTEIEKRAEAKKREIEQGEKDLEKKLETERKRLREEADKLEAGGTAPGTTTTPAPTETAPTGGAEAP
jgi:septal ring factor EnvC (AmiA/AmiB activator)